MCQVWLKVAWGFEEVFFFILSMYIIWLLSPLRKGHGPLGEETRIPFTLVWFVLSLVEIDPVVLENFLKLSGTVHVSLQCCY